MPTTHAEDRIIPKSALRHRPISTGHHPTVLPTSTIPRASRTNVPMQPMRSSLKARPAPKRAQPSLHWMMTAGLTMTGMIVLLLLFQLVSQWWITTYNDLHYGRPRATQIDAFVGHESGGKLPSHFIAMNLNSQVEIIEFPGGDARHARIYTGPKITGDGAALTPVLLSFADRNGDHLPDMSVQFGSIEVVYLNVHGSFVEQ